MDQFNQENQLQQNAAQLLQQAQNANLMSSMAANQDQNINSNSNILYSNFQNMENSNVDKNGQNNQVIQPNQALQFQQQSQFLPQMTQVQNLGNNYGQEFQRTSQANFPNDNQVQNLQEEQNYPNNQIPDNINVSQQNQNDIYQNLQNNQMDDNMNLEENEQSQKSSEKEIYHISANVFQMAQINKMLPKGFKFDVLESVQKQTELHQKKTAGLANYMVKKPEIQNEKRQQKIIQKYNQKKLKEQEKLQQQQQNIINYCTMREGNQDIVKQEEENKNGFYEDLEAIKNNKLLKSQSMMQKKSSTLDKKTKFQKIQQPQNINSYVKKAGVETKKLFELTVNNAQNQIENQDQNNVISISNFNKAIPFDSKDKPKRGRRPNAVKNYASLINNSDAEEEVDDFSKNDSKRIRKTKVEMMQQQQNAPINPIQIYQDLNHYDQLEPGTLFDEVDHSQLNIYDKYYKLLESIITHPSLKALQEVPLFFRQPSEQTRFYKEIMKEYSSNGHVLNFNQILMKLKNKKYGPGKNMIKEQMIQKDIRSIFQMVDKYYHYDQTSIKIKNQLSQHFEVELAASPNPKFQQFKQTKGEIQVDQSHQKLKRSKKHFDDTGSDFMDDDKSDKKNKKDKKEKKKDKKKGKDKKSKDKQYSNEFENDQVSNKDNEEDDEQLAIKQRLYENIMKHLNIEQKKGIIPIVQQQMSLQNHQVLQQQKFEFDLFSLPKATCLSLEKYVDDCIKANNNQGPTEQVNGNENVNAIVNDNNEDEIQKQIDEKLKEHQMLEIEGRFSKEDPQVKIYDLNNPEQIYVGDRHLLIKKISQLDTIQLRGIVPIVKQFQTQDQQTDDQKLEFDLYELPDQKCKELHNYVENCIEGNKVAKEQEEMEKQRNFQMNEIEMQNQDMYQLHMQQQQQQQQQQKFQQNQIFIGENGGVADNQQQQMLDQQQNQQQQQQQQLINNQQQQQQQFAQFNNQQEQTQQQNQQMLDQQQKEQQEAQNSQLQQNQAQADQENMILRFKLLESIKQLKDEKLDQLGQVMNTEEFKKIDSLDKGYALTTDKEQALIELDIEALSIKKVLFLQNFIDTLIQTANQEENAAAAAAGQQQQQQQQLNNQIQGQAQDAANKGGQSNDQMEDLQKHMEQFEQNQQAQLTQYQQLQIHISQQLEHQIQQYQETTMIINELSTLNQKADSLKQELPSQHNMQLRQYMQNEQVLQQNIKSLQAYQVEQSTLFEQQKQNSMLEMEQKKLQFQQTMQIKNSNGIQDQSQKQNEQVILNEDNNVPQQQSQSQKKSENGEQHRDQGSIQIQKAQAVEQNGRIEQQQVQKVQQQQQQDQQIANSYEMPDKQNSANVAANPQQEELKQPNENENAQAQIQNQQQQPGTQADPKQNLVQKQQQLNQLIYQYQINQNTMEELLQVSQHLQNLYVQHQNKGGQEGVDESLQQIQEKLLEHQQHIQNLAATQQLYEHQIIEIQQHLTNAQQPDNVGAPQQQQNQQQQQEEMTDQQQLNQITQMQQQIDLQNKQNDQQQQQQQTQENAVGVIETQQQLKKSQQADEEQQQQQQQQAVVQNENQQNGLELQQNQQQIQQQAQNGEVQGVEQQHPQYQQQQQQQQQMMGPQLDEQTQQLIQLQMEQILQQQNIQFTSQEEMQQYCLHLQHQLIQQHLQSAQNQNGQNNNQSPLEVVKNEDDGQPQANGMTPYNTQIEPKQEEK